MRAREELDAWPPAAEPFDQAAEDRGFLAVRSARLQHDLRLREVQNREWAAFRIGRRDQQQTVAAEMSYVF